MIVYIDLEHSSLQQLDPSAWATAQARRRVHCERFETLSGEPCRLVRFEDVSPAVLRQWNAGAVLVSGCSSEYVRYTEAELNGLRAVYREAAWPILGICAGFQLMAQTYGAPIGPMGWRNSVPVSASGANPFPELGYRPGMKEEHGFLPVQLLAPHPLFEGLGPEAWLYLSHFWEVASLPAVFQVLAQTELCGTQAAAHQSRPLLGTQFHPEEYDSDHPAGARLLSNFFRWRRSQPRLLRSTGAGSASI